MEVNVSRRFMCIVLSIVLILILYKWTRGLGKMAKTLGNPELVMKILNNNSVDADDPTLLSLLREFYIKKPSMLPYNLTHPEKKDPSPGQATFVDGLLKHKTNGFFIECGAATGERHSNTLFFERSRNWTGLLIEVNPISFQELTTKHRNVFSLNACLSMHPYPTEETLFFEDVWAWSGNIVNRHHLHRKGKGLKLKCQCFPLYSILLALNQLQIDYFSLDIEGAERGVLDSLPWDKVNIDVMSIEYEYWSGGKSSLQQYMEGKGYKMIKEIASGGFDIVVQKQH